MNLNGKVALVTGSATGLGRAFAEELLKHGVKVAICDLDSDAGELTTKELGKHFGKDKVLFCHCDVTDFTHFEEAFQSTITEFDGLDIVINNAELKSDQFWELEVDLNLNGVIRGTLLAQQFMGKDKNGSGGVIVNIGSSTSVRPQISTPIYTATKHAILALSRSCGDPYHYNQTGVKVIALCPGPIKSDGAAHGPRFQSSMLEKAWEQDMKGLNLQSAEHVAKGMITVLKEAKTGSIWTIINGKSPIEIPYSTLAI